MGLVKGMRAIKQATAPRESTGVKWLKIEDGQQVKIRFINELDEDSPHFDPERGVAVVAVEHQSPYDFKRKAQCSMEDEGKCWACEQVQLDSENSKKWRPKMRFYTNVLVDNGMDDPYVAVWNMGLFKNPTWDIINDHFGENGSISNYTFKLKRRGSTQSDTTYTFLPDKEDKEPFDWKGIEPFDLEKAIRAVPYAEQAAHFGGGAVMVSNIADQGSDEPAERPAEDVW